MELVGEQKRIQALFSELRLADDQIAPRFAVVWNSAQLRSSRTWRPSRAFNFSFVAATGLLICALVSLGLWSKYSQPNTRPSAVVVTGTTTPTARPVQVVVNTEANPPVPGDEQLRAKTRSRAMRLAVQRRTLMLTVNLKAEHEAKAISNWQSPTTALLKSQNDELLKSLPQLNENADELKSFLTNTPK